MIAIIGLLWGQFLWINKSYNLENKELTSKMISILNQSITQTEDSYYCVSFFSNNVFKQDEGLILLRKSAEGEIDTLDINFWNPSFTDDSVYNYDKIIMSVPAKIETIINVRYMLDSLSYGEERTMNMGNKIDNFRTDMNAENSFIPLFDSILRNGLKAEGIDTGYEFFINIQSTDSITYRYPHNANHYDKEAVIHATLFKGSYFFKPYDIRLVYPSKDSYIFSNLIFAIGGSFVFILILLVFILIFIKTIVNQRLLAEMKSDFMHNMTHEFKTPLSNVNLALDTIEKKMGDVNDKVDVKLLKIIREENLRLQDNVNLILNTAFYEQKEIPLNKEILDINKIVKNTSELFTADIIEQRVVINFNLMEDIPKVSIDETHFTNLIYNLIDNAIKYSKGVAQIDIMTFAKDNIVVLNIQDKGIGIPSKSISHIFDKFYRVPTGKIHDVKGFGLGLTYVKYIADAHKAKISIKSKSGVGTTFSVFIPVKS